MNFEQIDQQTLFSCQRDLGHAVKKRFDAIEATKRNFLSQNAFQRVADNECAVITENQLVELCGYYRSRDT
jgi:hypothetical protein